MSLTLFITTYRASVSGPSFRDFCPVFAFGSGLRVHESHVALAIGALPIAKTVEGHVQLAEGATLKFEVEPKAVGAVRDLRALVGALKGVLCAVVDGVGEAISTIDRTVGWAHSWFAHEPFCS